MSRFHLPLLAAACLVLLAGWSAADEPAGPAADAPGLFASLDANKDGQLSGDEVPADKKGLFDRLVRLADSNHDGNLSSDEFAAGLSGKKAEVVRPADVPDAKLGERADKPKNGGKLFKRLDANGDGLLTLDEVPQERRRTVAVVLKRLKKDNDAGLTKDEFVRAIEGRLEGPGRPNQPPPGFPPRGGLFLLFDADHDGKLSASEISASADVLRKLDKNGDGNVTPDELMAAMPRPRGDN